MAGVIGLQEDQLNLGIDSTAYWMYWDRDSMAATSTLAAGVQADFFTQTNTKTAIQTNFGVGNGALPKGFNIVIFRIRIALIACTGAAAVTIMDEADIQSLSQNLLFELNTDVSNLRVQQPLASLIDPMQGIYTAATTLSLQTQPGVQGLGTLPDFGQISLTSEQAISARIYAPTAITLTTGSLATITYQVALDCKRWTSVN